MVSETHSVQHTREMKISAVGSLQNEAMKISYTLSTLFITMLTVGLVTISGCSIPKVAESTLTVEGVVAIRGNEPFTAIVLETQSRNYYVLKLAPDERRDLITPARYRVRGRLYLDDWNGRNYAHIDVAAMHRIDP